MMSLRIFCVTAMALMAGLATGTHAAEPTAAELFPASSVLYAEMAAPSRLVETIIEHPLRSEIEKLDGYKRAVGTPQYRQFHLALRFVETRLGMGWRETLEGLTQGGIYAAFDLQTEGLAILMQAKDEQTLEKIASTVIELAREDAQSKGKDDPYEEDSYRDVAVYKTKDGAFATHGKWLIVTNKGDLGKQIVDALLDGPSGSLADSDVYRQARGQQDAAVRDGQAPTLWSFVNIDKIRQLDPDNDLFKGQADNPVGELLIGGLLETLQHTPFVTGTFDVSTDRLALNLGSPHKAEWVSEVREYFFGPNGDGRAPQVLNIDEMLFSLSSYRDLSEMWLRAGDLFNENVNDGLAEADSNLSTFFSGKDFGEDILGAFGPQVQLIATRQQFGDRGPRPSIRLPAFALVFEMTEPEITQREMKRTFHSFIGFLNVIGAMEGQPQLEIGFDKIDGSELITTGYIPEVGEENSERAQINFNFSPTVAFAGERFILSSTEGLSRRLITAANQQRDAARDMPVNTQARMDAAVLREVLADNENQLISQNMLEQGRTREEAEEQISALLTIVSFFEDVSMRLTTGNTIDLSLELRVK